MENIITKAITSATFFQVYQKPSQKLFQVFNKLIVENLLTNSFQVSKKSGVFVKVNHTDEQGPFLWGVYAASHFQYNQDPQENLNLYKVVFYFLYIQQDVTVQVFLNFFKQISKKRSKLNLK